MSAIRPLCAAALIFFACVPAALSQISRDPTPVVSKNSPEDVAIGKKLYEATCSRCHGLDAGGSYGPSLQGAPERLGDDAMGN
jgi:mono/diheme cytochrome c family protein